jgi:hypothetical protein
MAEALLAECRQQGVALSAAPGGKLRCRSVGKLPEALQRALEARKADVLALLAGGDEQAQAAPAAFDLDAAVRAIEADLGEPAGTLTLYPPYRCKGGPREAIDRRGG